MTKYRWKPKTLEKLVIGWCENVSLPSLGIDRIKAKIDTGARTSALHAYRVKKFQRGDETYVRFFVHPVRRHRSPEIECEAPLIAKRTVTSSNGAQEQRYVIETPLRIGGTEWPVEITLTNRDEMSFRMLLGRQALRPHVVVDPGACYTLNRERRVRRGKATKSSKAKRLNG